jgi:glycosyltransferase involved in cell wall biosynthesis
VRVLAWVPQEYDTSPGQRFRVEQWEPYLRREGIDIVYAPFAEAGLTRLLQRRGLWLRKALAIAKALSRRVVDSVAASNFDLVYILREGALLGPAVAERLIARRGIPFVFDFDDAVWVRYVSPANSYLSYLRCPGKTAYLCRGAREVIAGNKYLAAYATRYSEHVTIVPTTIDTNLYHPDIRAATETPVIGWTGSYSTAQYLSLVRPVLERLRRRHAFRMLVVGGGEDFRVDGLDVEFQPWRAEREIEEIKRFDIGIMPLPDAEWERGKCGLKALQYMALGIPPVVSPVGINQEIVTHGANGLVAENEAQWESSLEELLTSLELRRRLGTAARETVERSFSGAHHASRVGEVFRKACAARGASV